ncbi:MAG: protein-disulfide reductase DsbD N-terminal domain-containing protein [Blastocatellia bacterium]|nr:protein-disulfide reductase DsbD N-terminal domain-containing protein [Blastocatellia bacterium]
MKRPRWRLRLLCFLLLGIGTAASGNHQVQPNPIKWSLKTTTQTFQAGAKFTVQLTAQIEEGWHLYALEEIPNGPRPTQITIAPKQPFSLTGTPGFPAPHTKFDENFGVETQFYEKSVTFDLPINITAAAKPGPTKLVVQMRYQVCNEQLCLPLKTVKVEALLKIKSRAAAFTDRAQFTTLRVSEHHVPKSEHKQRVL